MPRSDDSVAAFLARRIAERKQEIAPEATDGDRLREAVAAGPVVFARDVLRIWLSKDQRRIVEAAVARKRLSIASGHKLGKSITCAVLALWFFCSGARVVLMAPGARQVDGIIWREIKRLVRGAALPIPGGADIGIRPSTGLTDPVTQSEIRGYTARDVEALAGTSGARIVYIVDEASGVPHEIFHAIEGNRAGGNAWVILISNPTRADGEFYDAFHSKSQDALGEGVGYWNLRISSRDSPNVTGEWREMQEWDDKLQAWRPRLEPVPGLADPGWIAEKIHEHGEGSPFVLIRIDGSFAVAEELKIFPADLILASQQRWDDAETVGALIIGCDPAGDGNRGDRSAFAPRCGLKIYEVRRKRGLSAAAHCAEIDDLIATWGRKGQPVFVNVDAEGETGYRVYVALRAHAELTKRFLVVRIRGSSKAIRQPLIYHLVRDEIHAVARAWMRGGGAIPTDAELEKELHAPEWFCDLQGHQKVTKKDDLIKLLGHSPDLSDAVVMACWEGPVARAAAQEAMPTQSSAAADASDTADALDPWSAGISPYG